MTMRLPFSEMRCNSQQMHIHFSLSIVPKYQYTLFVYLPFIRTYIYIYMCVSFPLSFGNRHVSTRPDAQFYVIMGQMNA